MIIDAVIVLFNDDTDTAVRNIKTAASQVDFLYLIDNSACSYEERFSNIDKVEYIPQRKNIGIAAAQNIGIRKALEDNADFIFFADPDSEIPANAVRKLCEKYHAIKQDEPQIGGICISAFNRTTNLPISLKGNFIKELPDLKATEVTYMMNSGSLIPARLFEKVGYMWEGLFIDDVDCEWCWRASNKMKARFYQDNELTIIHHLGNCSRSILGKPVSIAAPQRLYYQFRNYLWILRKGYAPRQWLRYNGWKYIIKFFYFSLLVKPQWLNFRNICNGILDGLGAVPKRNEQ